jgi:MTH538 TIR-like domain (DUF1863)
MADMTCNAFISHIHEDDADVAALKELLAKNGCEFRDSSVTSDKPNEAKDPDYIKSQILAPRIQWAGTVVVLISPGTHESEWVDWEIAYAQKLGKRIVGVWAHGSKDSDLPEKLDDYAAAIVGWQSEAIVDAINGKSDAWQGSAGETKPERKIAHYSC